MWASLVAQRLKRLPAVQETWVWSLGREDPLEKEMATHSSILAWRIPWMEEPGGLQSMGSQRMGHNWETLSKNIWKRVSPGITRKKLTLWMAYFKHVHSLENDLTCVPIAVELPFGPNRVIREFPSIPMIRALCFYSQGCCCLIAKSCLWLHGLQDARLPCTSVSPGIRSNSSPLSQWCHPTILSSVTSFPPALNLF